MKKLLLILLPLAVVYGCGEVDLSGENNGDNPYIPDDPKEDPDPDPDPDPEPDPEPEKDIFLQFCIERFDTNGDGVISQYEADQVKTISCVDMKITKLTDIDRFSNLETLDCSYNSLTSLDLSKNRHLTSVNCMRNSLRSLSVAGCKELRTLDCSYNKLTTLDLSKTTGIVTVNCKRNSLTSLILTDCTALASLDCSYNSLTSLDVSDCETLSTLDCTDNPSLKELILFNDYQKIDNLNKDNYTEIKYSACYNVGDKYSRNGKNGIVFYITDNGLHGKIVSEDETQRKWSTEYISTSATDENDGMANMKKIQSISGWHEKYPAFAWCADKGDGWYLPALNELKTLYELKVVELKLDHYSSTEYSYDRAWKVYMGNGSTGNSNKNYDSYVRAVSAF